MASTFYIGTESEVSHHAHALREALDLKIVSAKDVVDLSCPGDVAIFFNEHFDRFRVAIAALRTKQVATVLAMDGILEWRNAWENRDDEPASPFAMRPVLCDKVACIGPSQARVLQSWGNEGKIEVVGIPRLDHVARPLRAPERSDVNRPLRVLVMTAKWPAFTAEQQTACERSLRDLKAFFKRNKKIGARKLDVIWRLTRGLDEVIGVENTLVETTGEDLLSALVDADAVITTPSTAMLESMLMQCPVALLDYTNSPSYVDAAWRITCEKHISSVVHTLARPEPARMHHQESILADALACDGKATQRMVSVVRALQCQFADVDALGTTRDVTTSGLTEAEIYRTQCALDYKAVYPASDAFGMHDVTVLQGELAHARREMARFENMYIEMRAELRKAHALIERLQDKSLFGPILRIYRKRRNPSSRIRRSR